MRLPDPPLPPPSHMSQLTDKQQADVSWQLYRGMTEYAGSLRNKCVELVHWIEGEP